MCGFKKDTDMLEFARMAKVGGDWWLGRNASVQSTPKPLASTPCLRYRLAHTFSESDRSVSLSLTHLSQQKNNRFLLSSFGGDIEDIGDIGDRRAQISSA